VLFPASAFDAHWHNRLHPPWPASNSRLAHKNGSFDAGPECLRTSMGYDRLYDDTDCHSCVYSPLSSALVDVVKA
jgi:hypothetical protein